MRLIFPTGTKTGRLKSAVLASTLTAAIALILLGGLFSACGKHAKTAGGKPSAADAMPMLESFRDVPGITPSEIRAIETFQEQGRVFVYGMPLSTEAFLDENGKIGGFAARLCDWLSELFGVPFIPRQYELTDLFTGLGSGAVDFTGELRPTEERRKTYLMTEPIAERTLKYFRLKDSLSFEQIASSRKPRYGFLEGATTAATVSSRLESGTFEVVLLKTIDMVHDMLKSGAIDAFFYSNPAESRFDKNADVVARDFFPLVFSPVSLTTQKTELDSIITVVQKILENGGLSHITMLYNLGYHDYRKNKLFTRLTVEELEYLRNCDAVPFVAEHYNYPISFYNSREKRWQGIFFDILKEVEELMGLSFKLVNDEHTEWPTMLRMLEEGEAFIIPELLITKEREGRFLWSKTSILTGYFALLSKSETPNVSINEVANVKVALTRGTAYAEMFRTWFPDHANSVEYESSDEAFAAMDRGDVDMVSSNQRRLLALTNYHELSSYKANLVFDNPLESLLGFNKDEAVLCSIIDKCLQLIDVNSISAQWVNRTYDYQGKLAREQRPWLFGAAALLLCILALLFILFQRQKHEGTKLEALVELRTRDLARQIALMGVVNDAAILLVESDAENYIEALNRSMEMICKHMDTDRVYLWQNRLKEDGKLYFKQVCKWTTDEMAMTKDLVEFAYKDTLPKWEQSLSQGLILNGPLDWIPDGDSPFFVDYNIKAILAVPLFLNNSFWGFVSIDDCQKRHIFYEAVEQALETWGLLAMGTIQRGEIARNMRQALVKSVELQKDLETAVENAKAASQSKSAFLANMSHEIRTPLNAIIGLSELELGSGELKGETSDSMEKIYSSGMTLLGIINDILDISKIESGKLELVPIEYDVPSLINDTVNLNIVRIGSKPIQFRLHPDENTPARLFGDELRIKQIFNNLLSNAFKYTQKGTVDWYISAVREGETIWLESRIEDTGIGIKEENISMLFTEYGQVDTRSNRKIEGTGLGLSISQKMARLMDGEITVTSEYGKGSIFKVRLRQKYMGDETIGKAAAENLAAFNYVGQKRNRNRNLIRAWIPYATILVVDDMSANLTVAKGILKPYGLTVDIASSGYEAIEKIKSGKNKYSAVFMDHMMPEMDGIQTVKIIREEIGMESEYAKNIPIIALTANAIMGNEELFLNNGFQAFLSKPIDIMQMDTIINRWVRDKKLEKELKDKPGEEKAQGTDSVIDTLIKIGENIRGLDIRKGLAEIDNDTETWLEVVRIFIDTTPALLEVIKDQSAENLSRYTVTVHGIKGTCYSFGATEAGDNAKELEMRSKHGDMAFISGNTGVFIDSIEKLINDLKEMLERIEMS